MSDSKPTFCNFCGKSQEEVVKLVVSPTAGICNECITLCTGILTKKIKASSDEKELELDPRTIYNYIDQYVIAQRYAKEKLA